MATIDRYPLDVQYCGVCGMPPEVDVAGELYEAHTIKLLPVVLRIQRRNSEMPRMDENKPSVLLFETRGKRFV